MTCVHLAPRDAASSAHSETLSAVALGDDRYRLLDSAFEAPLAVGDVVRTVDVGGLPHIVAVDTPSDKILSVLRVGDMPDGRVKTLTQSWCSAGAAWSQSRDGLVDTVWRPETAVETVIDFVRGAVRCRPDWQLLGVYTPTDRAHWTGRADGAVRAGGALTA